MVRHESYETGSKGAIAWGQFRKPRKFGLMLGKIKEIQANLSQNMLNSGYFITILDETNSS
jgi:hypothetical protein